MTTYAKLAKRIWVGTYEFKVVIVPVGDDRLKDDDPEAMPAEGLTDTGMRAIYIVEDLDLRRLLEVVWHEVQHAINWVNDLEDSLEKCKGDLEDIEELSADISGRAWTALLLDNPRLQQWITRVTNQIRRERASA